MTLLDIQFLPLLSLKVFCLTAFPWFVIEGYGEIAQCR